MVGRRIKNRNLNPVPRTDLPDFDEVLLTCEEDIDKITNDIYKNWYSWYSTVHIADLKDEIRSTIMMVICIRWDLFRKGIIDDFPPTPGFIYVSTKFWMQKQYAPINDILCYHKVDIYNTIEGGCDDGGRNIIGQAYRVSFIATKDQNVPLYVEPDPDDPFNGSPDLIDFWFLGFSVKELAIIYNLHPSTITKRIHNYYDAMEISGARVLRPRLQRRKRVENRFKKKKKSK